MVFDCIKGKEVDFGTNELKWNQWRRGRGGQGGPWPPLKKICRMISTLVGNFEIYNC